jgi:hypothetical protein
VSPVKNIIIVLGIVLTLTGGSSAVVQGPTEVSPIVIAREAEAVTRAFRLWMKKPVPGLLPAVAPRGHGVACTMQEHRSVA